MVLLFTLESKAIMAREGGDNNNCPMRQTFTSIGAVFYYNSRLGKEQKVAMDIAIQDLHSLNCSTKLVLRLKDSQGNSARATSAGKLSIFSNGIYIYDNAQVVEILFIPLHYY